MSESKENPRPIFTQTYWTIWDTLTGRFWSAKHAWTDSPMFARRFRSELAAQAIRLAQLPLNAVDPKAARPEAVQVEVTFRVLPQKGGNI